MIVGNGDIASVLPERKDLLFFASGVSNSQEKREFEYEREVNLLNKQDRLKHIVYFSTLAVFYSNTRYAMHKRVMEKLIKDNFEYWTIIRIGNITWGKNLHTFINAYKLKPYVIKDEYRYVVGKEEFSYWIDLIPSWNCEMNILGTRMKVINVLKKYGNA